jgi:spermidine/putrescine transport system substrate-binding protein
MTFRRLDRVGALIALLVGLGPLLAACGGENPTAIPGGSSANPSTAQEVDKSKLSKELNFYTWVNYMKPEVLDKFQQEFGVKVILDTFDSNEALLAKLQAGATGYDVIVPSDYMVEIMGKSDLLEPLDKSLLPNIANIDPSNLKPYYDPDNKYSMPWKWGTSGFAYDSDKVSPAPDSWAVMFDEKYKGQISMLNDVREVPAAAAHLLGFSENTTNPDELAKIKEKLLQQKPLVKAYTSDTNRDLLLSGEVALAQIYTNDGLSLGDEKPSIKYVIPKEGCTIWQDNLAIPKAAPNKYTAHVFINFLMRDDIEAENLTFIKAASPNKAARAKLAPEIANHKGIYPDAETMKKLEWIQDLGDKIDMYDRMWTEIKNE